MFSSGKELTDQQKTALMAGTFLIIMTIAAIFSYGFVHGSLVVKGDASTTFDERL